MATTATPRSITSSITSPTYELLSFAWSRACCHSYGEIECAEKFEYFSVRARAFEGSQVGA